MTENIDIRTLPFVEIVTTYTKTGRHVSSVTKTPDGRIIEEVGRQPYMDVEFIDIPAVKGYPWEKE